MEKKLVISLCRNGNLCRYVEIEAQKVGKIPWKMIALVQEAENKSADPADIGSLRWAISPSNYAWGWLFLLLQKTFTGHYNFYRRLPLRLYLATPSGRARPGTPLKRFIDRGRGYLEGSSRISAVLLKNRHWPPAPRFLLWIPSMGLKRLHPLSSRLCREIFQPPPGQGYRQRGRAKTVKVVYPPTL